MGWRLAKKKSFDGYLCGNGWEEALCGELAAVDSECRFSSPAAGLVIGESSALLHRFEPVFARQWLPECVEIQGDSIAALIQELGRIVDPYLDQNPIPWTLHCYTPDLFTEESEHYAFLSGRPSLLHDKFMQRMGTYRRRALERFAELRDVDEKRPFLLVQAVLVDVDRLWVSVTKRFKTASGRYVPLVWRSSSGPVATDPQAPCRSYYKLEEAWMQAGIYPKRGETCIDLGAAPGGWTWAALKRGARVVAVDFADLKDHVERHPRCEHSRDNGYSFMPARAVDWMFCDMIVRPMATLGLLERWLEAKACRRFVVNVKFRGKQPESILTAISELQARFAISRLLVRHLYYDRNEITLIGL